MNRSVILFAALLLPSVAQAQPAPAAPAARPTFGAPESKPEIVTDISKMPGGKWDVSVPHTQVVFSALHNFISPYYGRIDKATGSMELDPKKPENSKVTIDMKMTDFSTPFTNATGKRTLDENLCKPEALDCAQFLTMNFVSTGIKLTGKNQGDISGNFTMHGVTKPVVLHTTFIGMAPGPGGRKVIGFSANGVLKRSDFGVDKAYWNLSVSDEVNFMIEVEFSQLPPDAPQPPRNP